MPLTLVLGPANSAKAGEVLGAYAAAAHRGALLVVPTVSDAEHYSRELAAQRAVFGTVLTFAGLAGEVARRAGYPGRRLSSLQRERCLRHAIADSPLSVLARSAGAPGFATAAGELISELERSLVAPERFGRAMRAWAAADARRAEYARELAAIYDAYVRRLDRLGRVDTELFAWRALDALRAAPGRWGTEAVFFYGFDDLTPLEQDAVETLSRVVGVEVTVSLTYEAGRAALSARAETVEELRPLAERVLELPALDEHYAAGSRAALHHLERSLFQAGAGRVEPGDAVVLLESGGQRAEAELIAGEVLSLLRAGVDAEEIVVVCRSLAGAAPLLGRVFEDYGIPVASEYRTALNQSALGHGLLALARCAWLPERQSAPGDLLAYLRTPGLLDRPEIADRLEAEVRREELSTVARARERLGWELNEIDALATAEDPGAELARQARRLFALPHREAAPQLAGGEELDASALAAVLRACTELSELGEPVSHAELLELLGRLELRPTAPTRPGAVQLAEPLAIRARRFRAVFVCGMQEGEFPRVAAPEPFLSDDRRFELAASSGLRLGGGDDTLARERYLFYACVSRATEKLVLSYRSSDEEGSLALPSPFIADVAELLVEEWPQRRRRRLLADVVWPAGDAPTARELARARAAEGALAAGAAEAPVLALGEPALARVRHRELVSAGALEAYSECPVRWLVERELQPEPFEPDSDPLARGNFVHRALERLFTRLGGPITESSLADAQRILGEVLAELGPTLAPERAEGIRAGALRAIEAELRRYLEFEAANGSELQNAGLELRFGFADEQQGLPPLELDTGVRVRGVIDRLDLDADGGAIVRDYKTGSSAAKYPAARWAKDRQLQVALYMLAAQRLLGRRPVAGFYQPVAANDLRARGVYLRDVDVGGGVVENDARDQAELDDLLADAESRAVAIAAALRAGELTPCPETCSRDGCMYPGICRVG
jgi:ATP-dependent helicase/DNAse subunit B